MSLERFIIKQKEFYPIVFKELENGKKETHWMWFVFPQIAGLGTSYMATYYVIKDKDEAISYFNDDYLRNNYLNLCNALLCLNTNDAIKVFGDIDAMKLKSSLTLFYLISGNFTIKMVLDKYYNGELDGFTKNKLI